MGSDPTNTVGDGRYALIEAIGNGGMATVYLGRDLETGGPCAVKVLLDQAATTVRARTRFLHEARTTALLDHPNIVRVMDVGDDKPPYYIVMEYAEEGTLAQRVRSRGARPPTEALGWTMQALCGLHWAHEAGVVHRDIKPHNMLLARADPTQPWLDRRALKLTDFGIAKWSAYGTGLTGADDSLGTLAYMAPEQRADPRQAGPQSDLYGVGATLYLLMTRRRPIDVAMAHRDPTVFDRLPAPVRPVVKRATARDPADRYASAVEMARAVAELWATIDPGISAEFALTGFDPPL